MKNYCEDNTILMVCKGDSDSSRNGYKTRVDLDEQIEAHNQNIRMRGATDALRGLRVWLDEKSKEMGGTNEAIDTILTENIADLAEMLWGLAPDEDDGGGDWDEEMAMECLAYVLEYATDPVLSDEDDE